MDQIAKVPYVIEGSLPDRYPRGWFCVGANYEFDENPKMMNYFGTSLVGYRGEDGKVHILDAYCPHMGANLADGHVQGNSVVCPFHSWSWGPDGVCDDIPYAEKIPDRAIIKAWPTMEENDLVYVWNDPDGGEPIKSQEITRHPWLDDDTNWSPWIIDRVHVDSNARELIDNMADIAHFRVVHELDKSGMEVFEFKNIADNHTYRQIMKSRTMDQDYRMESEATYYGPGYMIHTNSYYDESDNLVDKMMSLVMNVPTGMESFEFLAGFRYIMPKYFDGDHTDTRVKRFMHVKLEEQRTGAGVYADLAIWLNKCTIDNPILCDGDGPVNRLRQWYEQFLVPVDQVPEILKERKVYEKKLG